MNKPIHPVGAKAPADRGQHSSYLRFLRNMLFLILTQLAILAFLVNEAKGQCSLFCNDNIGVALDASCTAEITYDMVLEDPHNPMVCSPNAPQHFEVVIMNRQNRPIPGSPVVNGTYIGQTLTVKVKHLPSRNNCWGTITIQDGLAPALQCPADTILACTISPDTALTGQPVVDDCSDFSVLFFDRFENYNCQNPTGKTLRTWRATDQYGQTSICTQTIFYKMPELNDVQIPKSRDGIHAPALLCDSVAQNPQLTEPDHTGYPAIDGQPIINGGICNIGYTYSDERIAICKNSFKILREWTIAEWCTGAVEKHFQLIKVVDKTAPLATIPTEMTIDAYGGQTCADRIYLPPVTASDNCSDTFFIKILTPYGNVYSNGGYLDNFPVGTHPIQYEVSDECGNSKRYSVSLKVLDKAAPVAICRSRTVISLGVNGTATVAATVFDEGSYDNCCLENFKIKRMGKPDSSFADRITFDCQDTPSPVNVVLRIYDCHQNFNECMVQVRVDEKLSPSIQCPANKVLSCADNISDLSLTGSATGSDDCGIDSLYYADLEQLGDCNTGTVKRTWTVLDPAGNSRQCEQIITLENNFQITVEFPRDSTFYSCIDTIALRPARLPAPYSEPVISGNICGLVGINREDKLFRTGTSACFEIHRTWTVIDWCQYDGTSGDGWFQHQQLIRVVDDEAPVVQCPDTVHVDLPDDDCSAVVALPLPVIGDCNPNVSITASGELGSGMSYTGVAEGIYRMTYTADDGCGNTAFCDVTIEVADTTPPAVYCYNGLSTELGADGESRIWAAELDAGSTDNCTADSNLVFRIERYTGTTGGPPAASMLVLDCADYFNSPLPVVLWVSDGKNNWDRCITYLQIQDNQNACGASRPTYSIAGAIAFENGMSAPGVEMNLFGMGGPTTARTDSSGHFQFDNMPADTAYVLKPQKTDDSMNGVTTWDIILIQRHILQTNLLDSPLKIIAADANFDNRISVLDLLEIRKFILRVEPAFQHGPAWRFVPKSYQFQQPHDPLLESFPERINITRLTDHQMNKDFHIIKVGDINESVQMANPVIPRSGLPLFLEMEDKALAAGVVHRVLLRGRADVPLLGGQWALRFDTGAIEIIDVNLPGILRAQHINSDKINSGLLPVSWNHTEAIQFKNEVLLELTFHIKKSGRLSEFIDLDSTMLQAEAYDSGGSLPVRLRFVDGGSGANLDVSAMPNPFTAHVRVVIEVPNDGLLTWQLYGPAARPIAHSTDWVAAGKHILPFDESHIPANGVYHLTIQSGGQYRRISLLRQKN